jgi:hypothetical protein
VGSGISVGFVRRPFLENRSESSESDGQVIKLSLQQELLRIEHDLL